MNESILKKVKLLLKLADSNSNVNEAAAAMAKAQRFIHEHNLSVSELNAEDKEEIQECGTVIDNVGRLATWKKSLILQIARANGCFIYTATRYVGYKAVRCINIVGTKTDVEIVNYMFATMQTQIETLCKKARLNSTQIVNGRTWSNSFKMGAVAAICQKIAEEIEQAQSTASAQAIVIVSKRYEDAERYTRNLANLKLKKNSASNTYRHNADAYSKGVKAGRSVHVNAGLSASGGVTKQLT